MRDGRGFLDRCKKEMLKVTKGAYSDKDVIVCSLYKTEIGRTLNGRWVNMKNQRIDSVVLWGIIPKIPEEMHYLFDNTTMELKNKEM